MALSRNAIVANGMVLTLLNKARFYSASKPRSGTKAGGRWSRMRLQLSAVASRSVRLFGDVTAASRNAPMAALKQSLVARNLAGHSAAAIGATAANQGWMERPQIMNASLRRKE